MKSGGISRVIDFWAKRPELDQCIIELLFVKDESLYLSIV